MTGPMSFRILIVDDELDMLDAYRKALGGNAERPSARRARVLESELFGGNEPSALNPHETQFEMTFVRQGLDAIDAVRMAVQDKRPFAVIFLDGRMPPGLDGTATAKAIREHDTDSTIVMVTAYRDIDPQAIAEIAPPEDRLLFLSKPFEPTEVRQLARALSKRWERERAWLGREGGDDMDSAASAENFWLKVQGLAPREREVIRHVATGSANKEIAHRLGLSQRTVENYRAHAMKKLGVSSLPELVRLAVQSKLL